MKTKLLGALLITRLIFGLACTQVQAEESEPSPMPLYQYKPLYFLSGNYYTKIQLSFKAQVDRDIPLFFGYTQLMFWDLYVGSPYFQDLNYAPEVFYRFFLQAKQDQWLDFSPFLHESNGKGGDEERSWDRAYIRFHTRTDLPRNQKLFWNMSLWLPYYNHPNNPDLDQYQGIGELELTWSDFLAPTFERSDLTLRLYPGGPSLINPLDGGQELTLRWKNHWRRFLPLWVVQFFHGTGEDMLDYKQDRWALRAGIGF